MAAQFPSQRYFDYLAYLDEQKRRGREVGAERVRVEIGRKQAELVLLAKEMSDALGHDHLLAVRLHRWLTQVHALLTTSAA